MSAPVLVVGAGVAGWTVASTLRAEGYAGGLLVVGEEPYPPYDRPPLSKGALRRTTPTQALTLPGADRAAAAGIELRLGTAVCAVDTAARTITLADGSLLGYRELVIATGVRPRPLAGALTVRGLADLDALWQLPAGAHVAIAGAGFLGSELAATLRLLGHRVTLIAGSGLPLSGQLGPDLSRVLASWHTAHGVRLLAGRVAAVESAGVRLADGTVVSADAVLACLGTRPNTDWLAGSGLRLGDGVGTDPVGRAGDHEWAVGDVANPGSGPRVEHRMAAGTGAAELGALLAALLTGREPPVPVRRVPYHWTDHYGATVQVHGQLCDATQQQVVAGAVEQDRVAVLFGRGGVVVGAAGVGLPKVLLRAARLVRDRAAYDPAGFAASISAAAVAGGARPDRPDRPDRPVRPDRVGH